MQVIQNFGKAILVFCLALVMMVSHPLSAEAFVDVQPPYINFQDCQYHYGSYECRITTSAPFEYVDLLFSSNERDQQTITVLIDRVGPENPEDIVNIDVPGYGNFIEERVFKNAAPSTEFLARSSGKFEILMAARAESAY